jgi:hypothetical protein
MEAAPKEVVADAVNDAIRLGAIGFDAVKQIVLARIEKRPARLCNSALTRPLQRICYPSEFVGGSQI